MSTPRLMSIAVIFLNFMQGLPIVDKIMNLIVLPFCEFTLNQSELQLCPVWFGSMEENCKIVMLTSKFSAMHFPSSAIYRVNWPSPFVHYRLPQGKFVLSLNGIRAWFPFIEYYIFTMHKNNWNNFDHKTYNIQEDATVLMFGTICTVF